MVNAFVFCALNQQILQNEKSRKGHQQLQEYIARITGISIVQDEKLKSNFFFRLFI